MSLYSALYAGVSGMSAEASALAIVADNITNINTIGYKGTDAQFRTMVTDGRVGASYTAGGVSSVSVPLISKQGLLQSSARSTDVAIDGGGFFVTRSNSTSSGNVAYTRAGSFSPDEEGFLRNASQQYLYGWRLDASGKYNDSGSLSDLSPVRLSDLTGTASPTTKLQIHANLQSTTTVSAAAATYAAGDMASGTVKPDFTRSFDVSDGQGATHHVSISFLKTGANTWATEVYATPAADVTAPGGVLSSGTMKFNGDGSLDRAGSTPALFNPLSPTWTNGASSVPIDLQLGDDKGINGIVQSSDVSALLSSTVNGGVLGNLASIDISKTGLVSAIFADGTTRAVFQLPIATFPNPDGLTRVSGNGYTPSKTSGSPTMKVPGSLGAGNLLANNLESSTVDLASEFTNMIRFQRAYSASSKIITTVDDMLREVSDLKR